MKIQEERVFKVPLEELRILLKNRYGIDLSGIDPFLSEDNIVFSIKMDSESNMTNPNKSSNLPDRSQSKVRRHRRIRNRIKTRGWNIIAKIKNSKGLVANIYEPFVKALKGLDIPKSERKKIVRQILIANGNKPSEDSVDYFLNSTVEYLLQKPQDGEKDHGIN